jgi:hypothetical protein
MKAERTVFRGDRVWVLPNWCSCGFSLLLLLCFFHCDLHAGALPPPPKGTTTRLKATARAPLGVASRGGAVWPQRTTKLVAAGGHSTGIGGDGRVGWWRGRTRGW